MKRAGFGFLFLWLLAVISASAQGNPPAPEGPSPVAPIAVLPANKKAPAAKEAAPPLTAKPQSAPPAPSGKFSTAIEDNSFFIEEAINQEPGIVQHISNFIYARDEGFHYVLTQEWPVPGQRHQLSLTLPFSSLNGPPRANGFGDILLNYRFGALQSDTLNIAPRASLVIPSGSNDRGLGDGSVGVQFNLPLSHRIADQWVYHMNAGATILPHACAQVLGSGTVQRNLHLYNLGGSLIWLAKPNFNAMLETFTNFGAAIDPVGAVIRENEVFISPGLRWAINVGSLQIVPGIGVPFRVSGGPAVRTVLFYLSFEHPFRKQ